MFPQHLINTLLTRSSLAGESESNWSPPGRDYLIKTYCLFDVIAALGALLAVFVVINSKDLPADVSSFLTMRITVKNLLLLVGFSLLWQSIFRLFRLYDLTAIRSYRNEVGRVLGACSLVSLCTLIILRPAIAAPSHISLCFVSGGR